MGEKEDSDEARSVTWNLGDAARGRVASADSIRDRSIPLFERGQNGFSGGLRFMDAPFLQDMTTPGGQDVAIVGVPQSSGTPYRSGTRWGPQAIRRTSLLGTGYNPALGVNLVEALSMVDVGDVSVIPANVEKSIDQIDVAGWAQVRDWYATSRQR